MGYYKQFYGTGVRQRSGANVSISIEGLEASRRILLELPKAVAARETRKSLRTGAVPLAQATRKNIPPKMKEGRRTVKIKEMKSAAVRVGPYHGVVERQVRRGKGKYVWFDLYYLLYWHNYGTLDMRDSKHRFVRSRKALSAGWRGGIRPKGFIQQSYTQAASQVITRTNQAFTKRITDAWNKARAKSAAA